MKTFLITVMVTAGVVCVAFLVWGNFFINTQEEKTVLEPQEKTEVTVEKKELLPISLETKIVGGINYRIADPFEIAIAVEGLGKARFIGFSPDKRLFVSDMVNMNLSSEGKIYILDSFNEKTKKFEEVNTYLSGLRGPNSVDFYRDKDGQDWIYIALTKHLIRYPYNAGDMEPSGKPEIIIEFPNSQSENADGVVWHITRTILFNKDKLYISVGSGCNACEQSEGELRAMILKMDPDGENIEVYADGLRNAVGMTFAENVLYATDNGVDHLGPNAPDERLHKITEGANYGWPYCYESNGEIKRDNTVLREQQVDCDETPKAFTTFEPHSAPLGIEYFENAHGALEGSFLVALHGSFDETLQRGYSIIRVSREGEKEIFMDGFRHHVSVPTKVASASNKLVHSDEDNQSPSNIERFGRPVDFLQWNEKSFFFTDDFGGRLYYVYTR